MDKKTSFAKLQGKDAIIFYQPDSFDAQYSMLSPGFYNIYDTGGPFTGPIYTYEPIAKTKGLVKFKTGIISEVLDKSEKFFSEESTKAYKELEIPQRIGMIMFGPAGTGKTCTAHLIMWEMIERFNAIALDCTSRSLQFIKNSISKIRSVQDNPIIMFHDEVDEALENNETGYLSFLDGTNSVDKSIFIGCTNKLNQIPERIRNRRSRIKYLYEIKALPRQVYREYIEKKVPSMIPKDLEKFAYLAEDNGLTIDEVKHAVIDHRIEGLSIEKAIKAVKEYAKQEGY